MFLSKCHKRRENNKEYSQWQIRNISTRGVSHLWDKVKTYLDNRFGTGTYENDGLIQIGSNSFIKIQDNFCIFGVETSIQAIQATDNLDYTVEINEPNGMMIILAPLREGFPVPGAVDARKIKNNTSDTISVICIAKDEVKSYYLSSGKTSNQWNYNSTEGHYCQLIVWCTVVE